MNWSRENKCVPPVFWAEAHPQAAQTLNLHFESKLDYALFAEVDEKNEEKKTPPDCVNVENILFSVLRVEVFCRWRINYHVCEAKDLLGWEVQKAAPNVRSPRQRRVRVSCSDSSAHLFTHPIHKSSGFLLLAESFRLKLARNLALPHHRARKNDTVMMGNGFSLRSTRETRFLALKTNKKKLRSEM